MTEHTMTCEHFNDRLPAYLEQETDDATRAFVERHAITCAECGTLLADFRKLRGDATNLPELTPSRDLWPGIAARIEAPVVPIGTHVQAARPTHARRWMRGAMIAASLLAAAGLGYLAAGTRRTIVQNVPVRGDTQQVVVAAPEDSTPRDTGSEPPTRVAQSTPPATPASVPARTEVQMVVAALTADYDREIARLRVLIEQRRSQLDPATVAIIEKNLLVIDTAIADSKRAIAGDPASRFLIESLNQSLQSKVELMRTAALLPSRT